MTKIDLSKFLQNNFDEFVHLRALKNITDQLDAINAQQDTNITHAQSTADTAETNAEKAQSTADTAESNAEKAQQAADKAQQTADNKSSLEYQKADGTTVFAPVMMISEVTRSDIDNGKTSIGKGLTCLDKDNKPIDVGMDNQLLSVQGGFKLFPTKDDKDTVIKYDSSIQNVSDSTVKFELDPVLLHDGTIEKRIEDINISGKMNIDDLINTKALKISLTESLDPRIVGVACNANLYIVGKNLVNLPVTLNFNSSDISVQLSGNYTTDILTGAGLTTGTTYPIQIN